MNPPGYRPRVTEAIILANALVFLATAFLSGSFTDMDNRVLMDLGALSAWRVAAGEWWRMASAMFLHGSLLHIAFNMVALYQAGAIVERAYGRAAFALVYLGAGLLGSAGSLWWRQDALSVGASGAVFGVYGALAAFLITHHARIPRKNLRVLGASTVFFVGYSLVNGFLQSGIDNGAHVGGLLGGALLGWALAPRGHGLRRSADDYLRAAGGIALVVLAGTLLLRALPDAQPYAAAAAALQQQLRALAEVEERTNRRLAELQRGMERGEIGAAQAALALESEIAPLWDREGRAIEATVARGRQPEEWRRALGRYVALRRESVGLLVQALREDDQRKVDLAHAKARAAQAEVARLIRHQP
jgi:rhomboid protease GluP